MKFTLKDYQAEAVDDLLPTSSAPKKLYYDDETRRRSSVSLTAPTGAGKTVMAAAVIEALFCGNDAFDFEPDPGAVVIWFSDDPNLNEQTTVPADGRRPRSSRCNDLVTIEPPFAKPRLEPGKVYFLNTQKLSKNVAADPRARRERRRRRCSRACRRGAAGPAGLDDLGDDREHDRRRRSHAVPRPRRGAPRLQHEGDDATSRRSSAGSSTATPAIRRSRSCGASPRRSSGSRRRWRRPTRPTDRRALPPSTVDPSRVQESGLVKDTLVLDIPAEAGNFDTVLVAAPRSKLRDSTSGGSGTRARRALPRPSSRCWCSRRRTRRTPTTSVGRSTRSSRCSPSSARDVGAPRASASTRRRSSARGRSTGSSRSASRTTTDVRVLVAKDAISTGWDCPRAEVLVSFRPAKDHTHITQLLGRMVRSPLARRVPGDERLNSVDCILPFFDRTTAGNVVRFLTGQIDELAGRPAKKACHRRSASSGRTRDVPDDGVGGVGRAADADAPAAGRGAGEAARRARAGAVGRRAARRARSPRPSASCTACSTRLRDPVPETSLKKAVKEIWAVHVQEIAGRTGRQAADLHRLRRARRRPRDPRRLRRGEEGVRRRRRAVATSTTSPARRRRRRRRCARRT